MPMRTQNSAWWRRPGAAAFITAVLVVSLVAVDYVTDPTIDLSITYFLPITYAAWVLGRRAAILTALIAEASAYSGQLELVAEGVEPMWVAVTNAVVRLLVFLFVAEVTTRLARSTEEARRAAGELARLNEDLHRTYQRLDDDVEAAGLLQESVLSFAPLDLPGCQVGTSVEYAGRIGGDFVDTGTLDGRVYACIADVSGKGLPAALFTTLLKHLITDAVGRGLRGGEAVNAVDSSLCRVLPPDRFVTLFYVEVDPASGELEYSNAGHPEGILYRASTGEADLLDPTDAILGFCDAPLSLTTRTVRVAPGDVLVLFTDGATDAKRPGGERLGEEPIGRLVRQYAHLDAQAMAESITGDILTQTEQESRDDLAVICVKMTGRAAAASGDPVLPKRLK